MTEPLVLKTHQIAPLTIEVDGKTIKGWMCVKCHDFSCDSSMTNRLCPVESIVRVERETYIADFDWEHLLRRCIEAFRKPNNTSLDEGQCGCFTLSGDWPKDHKCPPDCPICEAVRVLGMTNGQS